MEVPVYDHVPDYKEVEPLLMDCVKLARKIPIRPIAEWKPTTAALWKAELSRLGTLFDTTLANPSPLALFNAVFQFICAPGAVLGTEGQQ